jgi:ABC-2 type transport system permease protein
MLALVLLTGVPAALVAIWFGWPGVAVGVLTGALCSWGLGLLAERRLRERGPELLETMRTGRKPETSRTFKFEHLSTTRKAIAGWCFGLGAIPLVPQGIIATVFVANGTLRHSWFLATYVPGGWRYPVAAAFIALGLTMYGTGLWLVTRRAGR